MTNLYVLNGMMYFNEKGKKIIPTKEQIREFYKLDDKIKVVKAEFPSTGFGIAQGGFVAMDYKTREEAERVREDIIESRVQSYLAEVR